MKKVFTAIIDIESFLDDTAADFAVQVVDYKGVVHSEMAVLLEGFGTKPLFYDTTANNIWNLAGLKIREEKYNQFLKDGRRQLASVAAVNRWLAKMSIKYNSGNNRLQCTAFNAAFDWRIMENTGIHTDILTDRFCLWRLFCGVPGGAGSKAFKKFILENHYWGNRTELGNCCYQTNAQVVAHYVKGFFEKEPHDALGDIDGFEKAIFLWLSKKKKYREFEKAHNWRDYQIKDNYAVK